MPGAAAAHEPQDDLGVQSGAVEPGLEPDAGALERARDLLAGGLGQAVAAEAVAQGADRQRHGTAVGRHLLGERGRDVGVVRCWASFGGHPGHTAPDRSRVVQWRSGAERRDYSVAARLCTGFALAAVALAASACGGDDEPQRRASAPKPATTPVAPLSRRDAPPAGVRRQVEWFGIGDPICPNIEARRPTVAFDARPLYQFQRAQRAPGEVEIGEILNLCPRGFPSRRPVRVTVRDPRGGVWTATPTEGEAEGHVSYPVGPRRPLGRYAVRAQQGSVSADLQFEVVEPRHRGVRVMRPGQAIRPGERVPVALVGVEPDAVVPVDVYRGEGQRYVYTASVPVRTDARGIGSMVLAVTARDPEGAFVLHPRVPGAIDQDLDAWVLVCRDC